MAANTNLPPKLTATASKPTSVQKTFCSLPKSAGGRTRLGIHTRAHPFHGSNRYHITFYLLWSAVPKFQCVQRGITPVTPEQARACRKLTSTLTPPPQNASLLLSNWLRVFARSFLNSLNPWKRVSSRVRANVRCSPLRLRCKMNGFDAGPFSVNPKHAN